MKNLILFRSNDKFQMMKSLPNFLHLRTIICLSIFFISSITISAQTVSGTVSDKTGEALIGATVLIKGTSNGTVTDENGFFELNDVPTNSVLILSYTGYTNKEILASGVNMLIELEEGATLDEVVVTAQKRGENVQKIPISISVMSGPIISERGIG